MLSSRNSRAAARACKVVAHHDSRAAAVHRAARATLGRQRRHNSAADIAATNSGGQFADISG
ncbi:hypothetical protein [Amycolatopsis sp. cmx-4-61]|uniref:hypothetical protein n=1 Tax=Amycolatopsis sp. cmx-4-61 TaxID=2790937 RepID=UPI0039799C12